MNDKKLDNTKKQKETIKKPEKKTFWEYISQARILDFLKSNTGKNRNNYKNKELQKNKAIKKRRAHAKALKAKKRLQAKATKKG